MRRWWVWIPLVIFGACSAFVVPSVFTAMDRSRQNRTIADIRSIATAIEAYETDHPDWKPARRGYFSRELASLLTPTYLKTMPVKDGWDHPYRVALWTIGDGASYRIWSLGKDGKRDAAWGGFTRNFNRDIVYEQGTFTQVPEGA